MIEEKYYSSLARSLRKTMGEDINNPPRINDPIPTEHVSMILPLFVGHPVKRLKSLIRGEKSRLAECPIFPGKITSP